MVTRSPRVGDQAGNAPHVTLAFVGDVSISLHVGRYVGRRARGEPAPEQAPEGFPFASVRERLRAADLAVGNLECVISATAQRVSKNTPLLAPVQAADVLVDAGFDLMGVANNHVFDFGTEGFDDTLEQLDRVGLPFVGESIARGRADRLFVRDLQAVRVGVLAWYIRGLDQDDAIAQVLAAHDRVDMLVVYLHWGIEGMSDLLAGQRQFAHDLVDAGADLVVGTHAHVLQEHEWYRGRLIAYGLGNFVFSGMGSTEATRTGGYLEVDVDETNVQTARLWRVRLDDLGAPRWIDDAPRSLREP